MMLGININMRRAFSLYARENDVGVNLEIYRSISFNCPVFRLRMHVLIVFRFDCVGSEIRLPHLIHYIWKVLIADV